MNKVTNKDLYWYRKYGFLGIMDSLEEYERKIRVENFIETFPDTFMRQVLTCRYIGRWSWVRISIYFHQSSPDAIRVACKRAIEKGR